MLALPVVVGPHRSGEMGGTVGPEPVRESGSGRSVELGETAVLGVGVDEEPLPPLDLVQPPLESHQGSWIFAVAVEARRCRIVSEFIEFPVVRRNASLDGVVLLGVCFDPVDLLELGQGLCNELPEISVRRRQGPSLPKFADCVVDVPAVGDDDFSPLEGEGLRERHDFSPLGGLVWARDCSISDASVARGVSPSGSGSRSSTPASSVCGYGEFCSASLWEGEAMAHLHLDARRGFAVSGRDAAAIAEAVGEMVWAVWPPQDERSLIQKMAPLGRRTGAHSAMSRLRLAPPDMRPPWGIDRICLDDV